MAPSVHPFISDGFVEHPGLLDPAAAARLFEAVKATRGFDQSLFLSEAEWESGPKTHKHTNPGPGNNLLESLSESLAFVESSPGLNAFLERLLGRNFKWYSKKLVCALPYPAIPDWLARKIAGRPTNTLGAFMRPRYRDISYYLDADLHQDILEWPRMPKDRREHRIVTLYVYLQRVTPEYSPVALLPGTHRFGATPFQHDLTQDKTSGRWAYKDGCGRSMESELKVLTGDAGYAAVWHSCLLHGRARATANKNLRISLRYILGRSDEAAPCLLDEANAMIEGPLYLEEDYNPGAHAKSDGTWTMRPDDFYKANNEA